MSIQKLEPDRERVEELCLRLKALMELTLLRDPLLNAKEGQEIREITKEIEEMGLYLTWESQLVDIDTVPRTVVEVSVFIPRNTTIH